MDCVRQKLLVDALAKAIIEHRGKIPKTVFRQCHDAVSCNTLAKYDEFIFTMWYGTCTSSKIPIKGRPRSYDSSFTAARNFCVFTADSEEQVRLKHNLEYNGDHETLAPGIGRDEPDFKDFNGNLYEHKGIQNSPTSKHGSIITFKEHSATEVEIWVRQSDGTYKLDSLESGYAFRERDYSIMPKWMEYDDFYELQHGTLIPLVDTKLHELGFVWPKYLEV